jgi:hypothetical protein
MVGKTEKKSESPGHVLSLEKNPACPRLAQLRKLYLLLQNFFQPASYDFALYVFEEIIPIPRPKYK